MHEQNINIKKTDSDLANLRRVADCSLWSGLGLCEDVEEEAHVQALEVDGVDDLGEGPRFLPVPDNQNRRIKTEEKAKVVAAF